MYGARPLSPQEFTSSLWAEVNELKTAISMPVRGGPSWQEYKRNIIRKIERDEVSDEDFAVIKRLVETRKREAAQMTITPVDTVQHCSPISQTPEPPSVVYFNLENNEDEMGPELEKLKSSSAITGLETPGQQSPPNEGVWETGRITADGFLTAGVDSRKKGNISPSTEQATRTIWVAVISSIATTPSKRRHKTTSQQNKQFDPGGRGEKAPPWNAAVTLPFFSGGELEAPCLFSVCAFFFVAAAVCACVPNLFFLSQVKLISEAADPGRGSDR